MNKEELIELYKLKKDRITDTATLANFDRIIANNETTAFKSMFNFLKSLYNASIIRFSFSSIEYNNLVNVSFLN